MGIKNMKDFRITWTSFFYPTIEETETRASEKFHRSHMCGNARNAMISYATMENNYEYHKQPFTFIRRLITAHLFSFQ